MSNAARRVLELFLQTQKQDVTGVTGVTIGLSGVKNGPVTPVAPVTSQKQHTPAGEGVLGVTTAPWSDTEEERAAIIEYDGGAPRSWAEALARLDPKRPPCDMSPKRWLQFIDDCGRFIDEGWAARAEELGWGPLELFGCDRLRLLQQYRHETDMPITLRDVRFQGQSGKHMLASSFSGFGPTADLRLAGIRRTGFTNFVPLIEAYLLSAA